MSLGAAAGSTPRRKRPTFMNDGVPAKDLGVGAFEEVGATGTIFLRGIIAGEEYNPDLQGEAALRVYDRMWRSDGQVAALLQVLMLPLLEAEASIKEASDDPLDQEIAQTVQDNLFGGMRQTWQEHLQFVLLQMLRDGFACEEKVWGYADRTGLVSYETSVDGESQGGVTKSDSAMPRTATARRRAAPHQAPASAANKVVLLKLAPRLSRTIYRVFPSEDDELDRVEQRVWRNSADGTGGSYEYPVIPGDKVAFYTHRKEGNNWLGTSILRAAYKHWWFKDTLYRIAAIAAERGGVGIPVWTEPPDPQKGQRDKAADVASSLHAHEKHYVMEPNGWKFRLEVPGHPMNLLPLIEHHDLMMARSVLAQFLNLDQGGSHALSMDISSFFLQALHSLARYLEDMHNRQIIRPLVDKNWKVSRYPTLVFGELDRRDIDQTLRGLAMMYASGAITNNADTENALRAMLGLPDLPPDATVAGGGQLTVDADSQGAAAQGAPGTPAAKTDDTAAAPASETPTAAAGGAGGGS